MATLSTHNSILGNWANLSPKTLCHILVSLYWWPNTKRSQQQGQASEYEHLSTLLDSKPKDHHVDSEKEKPNLYGPQGDLNMLMRHLWRLVGPSLLPHSPKK